MNLEKEILDDMHLPTTGFATFQKFSSEENALVLMNILSEERIDFEVANNSPSVNFTLNGTLQNEFEVKVRQEDFQRANQLLEKIARENIGNLSKDHYLFEFSDDELMEILQKPDEWGKEDYLIAQQILKDRGKIISSKQLENFKTQRLQALSKPDEGNTFWTIFGYISALLLGLLGIWIGWHLMGSRKTLPNGQQIFTYNEQNRLHGKRIVFIGISSMIAFIVYMMK